MYIAIPYELHDAYCDGEITPSMYEVMVWLHRRADWATGKVKKVSAEAIHYQTGQNYAVRTIQEALKALSDCGWTTSHHIQGQKGWYWVTIHNFTALTGAQKDQVLNPKSIRPYRKGEPAGFPDQRGDGVGDDRGDRHTDNGTDGRSDAAPILEPQACSASTACSASQVNQSTNQSINEAFSASRLQLSFLNDDWVPAEAYEDENWRGKEAWLLALLAQTFPQYQRAGKQASVDELKEFYELAKTCDDDACFPFSLVEYAQSHNKPALVPRSIAQLWNALCGPNVSPTNGLMAQYKAHYEWECKKCLARQKRESKQEGLEARSGHAR